MTPVNSKHQTLLYSADETPPWWLTSILSFQHVLLMFNGIIIVPAIISNAFDVSPAQVAHITFASIMVTSITTWIQAVRIGRIGTGYALFMGTSGTFFACTLDAIEIGGLALVSTLCLLSAPVEFIFSGSSENRVGEPAFRFSIPSFVRRGQGGGRSIALPLSAKYSYGHQDAYRSKTLPHLNPPLTKGRK